MNRIINLHPKLLQKDKKRLVTIGGMVEQYSDEAKALFARMAVEPSVAQKRNLNTLLKAGKINGWLNKGDVFYLFAQEMEQSAKLNIIKDAHNCTGDSIFTQNVGFAGDGVNKYLDTNYEPSTQKDKLSVNSASFIIGIQTDRITATKGHGNARLNILPLYSNQQTSKCNDNTNTSFSPLTGISKGISGVNRNSATTYDSWKQRVKTTLTVNSTTISSVNMYLGAVNLGYVGYANNDQLSFAFIGGGLTDDEYNYLINDIDAYLRAYNIGLLPHGNVELLVLSGQSNAVGQAAIADLPAQYVGEQNNISIFNEIETASNHFAKMNPGVNTGDDWGAEQSATHSLYNKKNNKVIIIKNVQNSQPITKWDDGQSLYIQLTTYFKKALDNYDNNYLNFGTLSLLWMQGEYECGSSAGTAYYEAKLRSLVGRVRAYDTRMANIQFVFCTLRTDASLGTLESISAINQAFVNVVADTNNTALIDTNLIVGITFKPDNVHYSAASLLLIGTAWSTLMP